MGLAGIGRVDDLVSLTNHPSAAVRLGAVVALRRLLAPQVAAFLHDRDAVVRREAIRAIHDDLSIPEALPALAAFLDDADLPSEEGMVRRALNANLRVGTEACGRRLLRFSLDARQTDALRGEAMECLGVWNHAPYLDRVEGLVRQLSSRSPALGDQLIQENLGSLLRSASLPLAQTVTRIVMQNKIEADVAMFAEWVVSSNQPPAIRAQALELLAERKAEGRPKILQRALDSPVPQLRSTALRLLAARDPAAFVDFVARANEHLTLPEKQTVLRLAGRVQNDNAVEFLARNLDALLASKLDPSLAVDVLDACRACGDSKLKAKLASYDASLPSDDTLARFRPALHGGDPASGREVFRSQTKAQCVRCHEAGGEGFQAGPVLAGIATRSTPEYLLESLIEPSKRIADGFATISVATKGGEVLDGIKLRETGDELTLRLSSGEIRKLPRPEIENQTTSSVSAMPPMGDVLDMFEIRDVLAYLQSLK
jgi:putative heme-binding domain-containing protein